MDERGAEVQRLIERTYRSEYPRILASVARVTRDLDRAEDAVQEALGAAVANWTRAGVPERPGAWLTTVARNRAIDALRRDGRRVELEAQGASTLDAAADGTADGAGIGPVVDDQLRLMFVTCHPALTTEARTALTLRHVCGLRTNEIARVLLVGEDAVTKRIGRARRKIRDARIVLQLPAPERLGERLRSVLECLYLVFTEGYATTAGDELLRADLCAEAIRLTRLVLELDPGNTEATSLLALELLQHSRSVARVDARGRPVLLVDQDRGRWDRGAIEEALGLIERARADAARSTVAHSYLLQATIAAEHAISPSWEQTDWARIRDDYDELFELTGSPVVALNRVVATSMLDGPEAALQQLDDLDPGERVASSHHWHLVRADLLDRLDQHELAAEELRAALHTTMNEPERAHVGARLARLGTSGSRAT